MKNVLLSNSVRDIACSVAGSALVGAALAAFTIPNDIAPGGMTGLATALAYISPIRVSIWTLFLNIPLLFGAWRWLGRRSFFLTLVSTALLSVFIELFTDLFPHYTENTLLAAAFGGAISGLGIGILYLRGISTGGTDLLALLLRRVFPNIPNGTLLLAADMAVVLAAVAIFRDINVAVYSTVTIFISAKVIDAIEQGVDFAKVIYIISGMGSEVVDALNSRTERGVTVLPASGGYTGDSKQLIITVTRRRALSQTLNIIKSADPDAFTFVMDSTAVHGEGFGNSVSP